MGRQRIQPQDRDTGLVPHPHRCTLRGDPASLQFPPLCAHCGAPAARRVAYAKVFRRTYSDSPTEHLTTEVDVPFCAACAARHDAAAPPRTRLDDLLAGLSTFDMLGALMPALAGAFCVYLAAKDVVRGHIARAPWMLGLAAIFGAIAWHQRRHVWQATRHLRVPAQTDVTAAFDFSDDVSDVFEPPRFTCTMRDARFAEALLALNADRVWTATSPQAVTERKSANRRLWLAGGAFGLVGLAAMLKDCLGS